MKPRFITRNNIPENILSAEKDRLFNLLGDQIKSKPKKVADQILEGKMKKFYEDNVLYDQGFILDGDEGRTIQQYIKEVEGQVNDEVQIQSFISWACK